MIEKNYILKPKKYSAIFLIINIYFLTVLPNFHFHKHSNQINCCIDLQGLDLSKKLGIKNQKFGFSIHNCPIENFVNHFSTLFILEKYHKFQKIESLSLSFINRLGSELLIFYNKFSPRSPPINIL